MRNYLLLFTIVSLIAFACSTSYAGKLYRWVDDNGVEHVTNKPPREDAMDRAEDRPLPPFDDKCLAAFEMFMDEMKRGPKVAGNPCLEADHYERILNLISNGEKECGKERLKKMKEPKEAYTELLWKAVSKCGHSSDINMPQSQPKTFERNIKITAEDILKKLVNSDFDLAYASTMRGGNYDAKVLYIVKFQVVDVFIENNSDTIVNINPNQFTLVSNMDKSYSYSSETFAFKNKLKFISINPLQSVDIYPGTSTEGFLVFEKNYEDEHPQTLFFKSNNHSIKVEVVQN